MPPYQAPVPNENLIKQLARKKVWILTNQGGIAKGMRTPESLLARLLVAKKALEQAGVKLAGIHVSLFSSEAPMERILWARDTVVPLLRQLNVPYKVYVTPDARKPNPLMLQATGVQVYVGDEDGDEQAAQKANIPFHRVERFLLKVPVSQ